jgi:DNA-binding response OmpR family regulator
MTEERELRAPWSARVVLVVDDDDDLRMAIVDALHHEGFLAVSASGGEQAVQLAHRHRPDVILLDYRMPDQLGTDVLRRIRRGGIGSATILMTGAENVDELLPRLGFDPEEILMKPFGLDLLLSLVDAVLPRAGRA